MRLACVQSEVVLGNPKANAFKAFDMLEELAAQGVELAIFPEAFLTGYAVDSREEAEQIAIERTHPAFAELQQACENGNILVVMGFAERDGDRLYNTAVLLEPGVEPRFYRKCHFPELGYDRFATPGDRLEPFDTRLGKIGILICYDMRPPEAARTLALKGADIIVLPTNWPVGAEISAEFVCVARAAENKVYFATCNRVGEENGFEFIGRSKIITPGGRIMVDGGDGEEVLVEDINLDIARNKRTVVKPGSYEYDVMASRRPELYGSLTQDGAAVK